jgi:hypothetical protein
MDEKEAVRIFDLVVKQGMLPATLDKLVPMSFMGAAAVKFYQAKVKLMDQLGATEEQRKATLADGQDAGEMLLNIEARIGELAYQEPQSISARGKSTGRGSTPSVEPPKHERLGLRSESAMKASEAIHRNPEAVAAIIKEARENEDIPTKTAVLHKIKADKAEENLKEFRDTHPKSERLLLSEHLEKSIQHIIQVNSVVKRYFDHPDQVDASRMKELMRQIHTLVQIVNTKTEDAKCLRLK